MLTVWHLAVPGGRVKAAAAFLLQPLHQSLLVEGQDDEAGEAAAEALDGQEEPVGLETMLAQASVGQGRAHLGRELDNIAQRQGCLHVVCCCTLCCLSDRHALACVMECTRGR